MLALFVSVLLLFSPMPVMQGQPCDPFVRGYVPGLVPIGTSIVTGSGVQGRVDAYYIANCFPGAAVYGLGSEAYVINTETYGPSGVRIDTILNRDQFEVVGASTA